MLSLSKFINIQENQDLYLHLVAEYYRFNILGEMICEYHGIPTDFERISKYCGVKIIKSNKVDNEYEVNVDLSEIQNINPIVNKIKFNIIKDKSSNLIKGEYLGNDKIKLIINPKINKYDLTAGILHELIHLYRDKQYNKIGTSLIRKLYQDSYNKYYDFIGTDKDEDLIKQLLYKTNNEEVYAFTAETKLRIEKEKPSTPEQALSILINDDNYQFYKGLINIVDNDNLVNVFPEIDKIYNEIFDTDYNINKVLKIVNKRLYNAYHKFMKNSSKYCCDCITIGEDKFAEKEALKKLNKKLYGNL